LWILWNHRYHNRCREHPYFIYIQSIGELSKYTTPTGVADYAALALIGGIGATFLSRGRLWDCSSSGGTLSGKVAMVEKEKLVDIMESQVPQSM
jgi:hypothetical protein